MFPKKNERLNSMQKITATFPAVLTKILFEKGFTKKGLFFPEKLGEDEKLFKRILRQVKKEIYINSTLAYCTQCSQVEMARIVAKKTGVFMERLCTKIGVDSVRIADDYKWYMERVTHPQSISKNKYARKSQQGCPFDCGICEWHSGSIQRAIISITNGIAIVKFTENQFAPTPGQSIVFYDGEQCIGGGIIETV